MSFKSRFTFAAIAALFVAQSALSAPAQVKGLFWKATSGTDTIYLLGSVHLGSKSMYPLPDYMEKAFANADSLVVEVNIKKVDQAKMAALVQDSGMYKGSDGLSKHVSASTEKKLQSFGAKYGLPAAALDKFRPWLAGVTISVLPMQQMGMQAGLGIDEYFLGKAEGKKPIVEVETAEMQLHLLASLPQDQEQKYLDNSLDEAANAKKAMDILQKDWIGGDVKGMEGFVLKGTHKPGSFARMLLEDRNPHMADVAEGFLKDNKSCFFVVGAAHMIGKEGIVQILKNRGYKVEQVLGS
jgi:uncharacterized protein YbaP (TraB family)